MTEQPKKRRWWLWLLIGAGVFLGLVIIASIAGDPEDISAPAPVATAAPPPRISAEQLYDERETNATRFDQTYKDKWVTVTGIVGEIDDGDVRLVTDAASYELFDALLLEYIALQDLPVETQASINKGQEFTATCKMGAYILGTMFLEECRVP